MTQKASLFVFHYVANGGNGTQAAISAGYAPRSARVTASQILTKVDIKDAIRREARASINDVDMARLRWLKEVDRLAASNIRNVGEFGPTGLIVKDSSTLSDDVTATVESVEFHETETEFGGTKTLKLKMHSKIKALELQGKFLGMLGDADQRKADEKTALSEDPDARAKRILELRKALGEKVAE